MVKAESPQIRFSLAAAGGEPDHIHNFALFAVGIGKSLQIHQDEGKLEGMPFPCGVIIRGWLKAGVQFQASRSVHPGSRVL